METKTKPPTKRIWHSLLYGAGPEADQAARDQAYVINIYSLIAIFSATTFGTLHVFVEHNVVVGLLELACSMLILLNMAGLRLVRDVSQPRTVLLFAIMTLMMILLVSGGTQDTGIFWLFVFPIVAFFLSGKSQGIWWVTGFFVLIIGITATAHFASFNIPYSLIQIRQLLISLTVVATGVFIYQGAREKALQQVEESQRDLQEYLDQMPTYSIKVGVDGRVLFANKVAKEASGLGERMVGTKFLDGQAWMPNEEARKRTEAAFYEAVAGKTITYDEQIQAASTEGYRILTVSFSLVPIFKNERIAYILVEARDVTSEREADRTKNEFVSLATQQLRPSITAITTAADELRASLPERLTDDQHENVQHIYRHTQHISSTVNNMLLVSGLELGNLTIHPEKTDITKLCRSVVEAARTVHLRDRTLEIGEDYAEKLPEVSVDPELMRTVLHNLVSNAIKFTPDSGQVNVRISKTEQKLAAGSEGSLQIEVQDNGHGIPQHEQKMIFTKFFRAGNTRGQTEGGSGQGLYITKKLLDYVGGNVSFTSKENIGTIFIVLLPLEGMTAHGQKNT